ncbi:hypothetical protein [Legionella shakespearei]|uniref:Uncharacterized protein n=1 Tax=Legionella shakespearei DSM 23087 TaxID=1122169 RepID=A0A0W0YQY2_9GAMM|nr:hypothetical protein [Legionella shakespearei]KTD59054.1 hypothetical protein Lsha_2086 [Legionella shakespearei DSM 23087]
MFNKMSTDFQLYDISLRFCANCLKKFCPQTKQMHSDSVRFFVPTIDSLFRNHFAYIELSKSIVDSIYLIEEHFSVDLSEIAEILHVEMGDLPSDERKEEIEAFFSYATESNFHFTDQMMV